MGNEILAIQDILERVLLFSDEDALTSCSIVNKQWSPIANRFLWSSLSSQRPLIELLAPLQGREDSHDKLGALDFDPTQRISWDRFHLYAPFVKRLTVGTSPYHYSQNVVATIALWRESLSILPNLEELKLDCGEGTGTISYQVDFASLFLSGSLRVLRITFHKVGDIEVIYSTRESGVLAFEAFLDAVPKRSPDIQSISLWAGDEEERLCTLGDGDQDLQWLKTCMMGFLPSLHKLQTITICPMLMHPELLLALSNLPEVKNMEICCNQHSLPNYESWDSTRSSLTSLETISLASTISTTSSFLGALTAPIINSFNLTLQSNEVETVDLLRTLMLTLGQKFSLLEELRFRDQLLPHEYLNHIPFPVCLRTLQALTRLSHLRIFSLVHKYEFHLSQGDFEHLVSHWPLLEELHLPSSKVPTKSSPYLTAQALVSLAHYCPRLRRLSIEVDWGNIDVYVDSDLLASPEIHLPYKFVRLESVDFGRSRVEENQSAAVAVLLVDLSIHPTTIQLHDSGGLGTEEREELTSTWKDIKKLMTIAAHYRRRMKRLQDRVEALEIRGSESITYYSGSHSPSSE